jgi:phage gp46-like protein
MDAVPDVDGDLRGSRLWLLRRALRVQETLDRAKEYTLEALQWLIEDRVSDRVEVTTEFARGDWMIITATVYRPKQDAATFRYQYNWQSHEVTA